MSIFRDPTGWDTRKEGIGYVNFAGSTYAEEMRRRMDYYNGVQFVQDPEPSTEAYITPKSWNSRWSGYGWDDINAMLPDAINQIIIQPVSMPFTRLVIDSKQVVYSVPAEKRVIKKNDEPDSETSDLLNVVYEQTRHDLLADQLCKWTGLFDTAFQITAYDKRKRRIVRRNLPPYAVYVDPAAEDPTDIQHPKCFVAIAQQSQGLTHKGPDKTVWQCWYEDKYWYETDVGMEYKDPGLTQKGVNLNPYKNEQGESVKPIVVTHAEESDDVYYQAADDLVFMNQRLDRDLTALSSVMEYQGFAIPVAKGVTPEEVESQPWSHAALFLLPPGDADMQFLHPAIQISEFFTAAIKKARLFARTKGIDPELVDPETKVQSGVSRAQARISLIEAREALFPKWLPYERETYYVTSIVWNTHNPRKKMVEIPRYNHPLDDDKFTVQLVFGELDPIVDPLADTLEKVQRLNANLSTRAEIIATERRLPLADAEKTAKEIKRINDAEKLETKELFGPKPGEESGDEDPTQTSGKGDDPTVTKSDVGRTGQSGNRPQKTGEHASDTGGSTTASSGNKVVTNKVGKVVGNY